MDSKLSDNKSPPFVRKQIVPINVMSNILSFIDHEYKMNLMKMVRLIIDFGWYHHAKFLLEKYYSEIPEHNMFDYNDTDSIVTGPHLLQMMGYFNKTMMNSKHTCNSFVYFRDMKDDYFDQEYGINRNIYNDNINKFDEGDIRYEFHYINLFDTDLDKAIKLNNIFDLSNNTLYKTNNKFKFTFAKPIPIMLNKQINIDIDMKLVKGTIYRKGSIDENRDEYVAKIIEYYNHGFSFNIKPLIAIDELCYKIIKTKNNIVTDMKLVDQIVNKFKSLHNDLRYNNIYMYYDKLLTKISGNNIYNLICGYGNKLYLDHTQNISNTKKLLKVVTELEEHSVLCRLGHGIKMNVLGEDVIFVEEI
jgi:hypothetical protein